MATTVIDAAVDVALRAKTKADAEAALRLLDAATEGIDEAEFPARCPEVIGAYESLAFVMEGPDDAER